VWHEQAELIGLSSCRPVAILYTTGEGKLRWPLLAQAVEATMPAAYCTPVELGPNTKVRSMTVNAQATGVMQW
jgi:hypothetical protein